MGVETIAGEIAVVGFVVDLDGKVSVGVDEVSQVKVAHEARSSIGVVAVSELSVYEETVVEQSSAEHTFIFCIVPSLIACGYVCAKVPIAVIDD